MENCLIYFSMEKLTILINIIVEKNIYMRNTYLNLLSTYFFPCNLDKYWVVAYDNVLFFLTEDISFAVFLLIVLLIKKRNFLNFLNINQ